MRTEKSGDRSVAKALRGKAIVFRMHSGTGLPVEAGFFLENGMRMPVQTLSAMAVFSALGVALGFALMTIPNVELVTATIFISGYTLGPARGFWVGIVTEGLFSGLHPLGAPAPPLFAAQVLSMAAAGALGGFLGKRRPVLSLRRVLGLGACGLACSLLFACSTSFAYAWTASISRAQLLKTVAAGGAFYLVHMVSNAIIFSTVVPTVLNALNRMQTPLTPNSGKTP
jgi:hypothetical protein